MLSESVHIDLKPIQLPHSASKHFCVPPRRICAPARMAAEAEEANLRARGFYRYTSKKYEKIGGVLELEWVQNLMRQEDTSSVLTAGAMVSKDSLLPMDHMFTAFLKVGLVNDMLCLFSSDAQQFHTIVGLGSNVCGHPKIVHGGLTSAIIDETLGGLNYIMKREGVIDSGPSFTVHLEVDYKKPIPSESTVICTANITSLEGRKTWVTASVMDKPHGQVYALGKALFVIPKTDSSLHQQNGLEKGFGERKEKKETEALISPVQK